MCAMEAGRRGRRVAVLERADRVGKKILISGGGRCNFTNLHCQPENFLSANPHFAKSALARYTPADFIALVEKHRIPYHEKTLGQLFCDRSARDILGMLEEECKAAGVKFFLGTKIQEVTRSDGFAVRTADAEFRGPVLAVISGEDRSTIFCAGPEDASEPAAICRRPTYARMRHDTVCTLWGRSTRGF